MRKKFKMLTGLIALFTVLFVTFSLLGYNLNFTRTIHYNETGNLDYNVYLKPNQYFEQTYLGKDKKYIANLIDYLDMSYSYSYKSDYPMKYKYSYSIVAESQVCDPDKKEQIIYSKKNIIVPEQTKVTGEETSDINIEERAQLNYQEYNSLIADFKKQYALSNVESNLNITMYIKLEGQNENFENLILDESAIEANIPLTNNTLAIGVEYREIDKEGQKIENITSMLYNNICYILSALFLIADIITIIITIKKYSKSYKSEPLYAKQIKKIFKKYNRIIISTEKPIDYSVYKIIEVSSFEDILNVSDCLGKPVLYNNCEENDYICFMVIDKNILYLYKISKNQSRINRFY